MENEEHVFHSRLDGAQNAPPTGPTRFAFCQRGPELRTYFTEDPQGCSPRGAQDPPFHSIFGLGAASREPDRVESESPDVVEIRSAGRS